MTAEEREGELVRGGAGAGNGDPDTAKPPNVSADATAVSKVSICGRSALTPSLIPLLLPPRTFSSSCLKLTLLSSTVRIPLVAIVQKSNDSPEGKMVRKEIRDNYGIVYDVMGGDVMNSIVARMTGLDFGRVYTDTCTRKDIFGQ